MNPRWGAYAPWPFVGATALLLILIVLTPTLISIEQPAPGILTQAYLEVDRVSGANGTHFYIRAEGATVRYATVSAGVDENTFNWSGTGPLNWTALRFDRYWNDTNVVLLDFYSTADPIAVNVSACYVSSSGNEFYWGELAFYAGYTSRGETLFFAANSPGVTVPSSLLIDNTSFPYLISLPAYSPTCPPP